MTTGASVHEWAEPASMGESYIPIRFDEERTARNARTLAEALKRSEDED